MSVLIKGIKMPTSCLKGGCPVDGFFCQLWEDKYWSRVKSPERMRHEDCPLIELPDHGDLTSIEAAKKEIDRFIGYLDEDMILRIKLALSKLPVVIPAERSEE